MGPRSRFTGLAHLVRRFVGSLKPGMPSPEQEAWVRNQLLSGEQLIWDQMSNPDRRHAIQVARAVVARLDEGDVPVQRSVVAAALLHDSGKVVAGFRTPFRVLATFLWAVVSDRRADEWLVGPPGMRRRMAEYRLHPRLGAEMLVDAGSDPLTSAWAAEHHAPERSWSVPVTIGRVLKACDDD